MRTGIGGTRHRYYLNQTTATWGWNVRDCLRLQDFFLLDDDDDHLADELARRQKNKADREKRALEKKNESDELDIDLDTKGEKWKQLHMTLAEQSFLALVIWFRFIFLCAMTMTRYDNCLFHTSCFDICLNLYCKLCVLIPSQHFKRKQKT